MRTFPQKNPESGSLLLEILVVLGVASLIIGVGSQVIYVSIQGSKLAGDKNVAQGVMQELFEGTRSATSESWPNLAGLTKGTTQYHPEISAGKWVMMSGSEAVTINAIEYTRFFTVQNVCRNSGSIAGITDTGGADTTCITSGGAYDPSTQRISGTVQWTGGNIMTSEEYLTRWQNKVCVQTSWSGVGSGPSSCPVSDYESKTNIDASTGTSLQLCDGC